MIGIHSRKAEHEEFPLTTDSSSTFPSLDYPQKRYSILRKNKSMVLSSLSRCFFSSTARSTTIKNGITTTATLRSISSAQLTISTDSPNNNNNNNIPQNKQDLQFGKVFSSHMLQIPYKASSGGWQSPEIVPFHDLKISPAASSLHYGER